MPENMLGIADVQKERLLDELSEKVKLIRDGDVRKEFEDVKLKTWVVLDNYSHVIEALQVKNAEYVSRILDLQFEINSIDNNEGLGTK